MINNILIKTSGDTSDSYEFQRFTEEKAKNDFVVVICGGGTKISKALSDAGFEIKFDDLHGRITNSLEERLIIKNVLDAEQKRLQDKFIGKGISVVAPLLDAASVLCPINGDNLVKAYYLGFDEIFVFTLKERTEVKKEIFKNYPKVKIIGV